MPEALVSTTMASILATGTTAMDVVSGNVTLTTAAAAAVSSPAAAAATTAGATTAPPSAFSDPVSQMYIAELASNMDQFFMVINGIIIFYIQAGFAFLEAGSVRAKNTTNILLKNTLDTLFGGIAYWMFGHAFAFGPGNAFIGTSMWPFLGLPPKEYAHWFFQFVYASTASSIVSGAVAERCSFTSYLSYTWYISGIVYPIACHWAWSTEGWLAQTAYHDFAGTGVVHMLGGSASLTACLILGPRSDIFDPETGKKRLIRGHSVPLAALGCFTLLFGIMAFNGGTLGHISQVGDGAKVALAVTNTVLSGAAGGLAALFFRRFGLFVTRIEEKEAWSFLLTVNGIFVGMVSICGGCDSYPTWAAVVCGVGAAATFLNVRRLTHMCKYLDDPLDAIAVHFGGGWWGLICSGLFSANGLISGNPEVLKWNVIGGLSIAAWCMTCVSILFGTLRYFNLHRVSKEDEFKGMDLVKHNEPAYPVESWMEEQYFVNGAIVPLEGNAAGGRFKGDQKGVIEGSTNMAFVMHETSATRYPVYPVINATGTMDAASGKRYSMASIRKSSLYGEMPIPSSAIAALRRQGSKTSKASHSTIGTIQEFPRVRTYSLSIETKLKPEDEEDEDNVYKTVR